MWNQVYDPFGNSVLSTLAAALPVVVLLGLIASNAVKAHIAAVIALIVANLVAIFIFTMPAGMSLRATVLGAVTGFFPIGWIVLNVIFLYRLTVEKGAFEILQTTIGGDAQSIVVASTATGWFGHEGVILRFVFWHSIALASLVGSFVMLQAYVHPFSAMVVK